MLILTRRIGEKIILGDGEVEFVILAVKGNHVRVGINAPPTVSVHREEIFKRIKAEISSCPIKTNGTLTSRKGART